MNIVGYVYERSDPGTIKEFCRQDPSLGQTFAQQSILAQAIQCAMWCLSPLGARTATNLANLFETENLLGRIGRLFRVVRIAKNTISIGGGESCCAILQWL